MKWDFVTNNKEKVGKDEKGNLIITNKQMDKVGNILQQSGAVQPFACQKCKVKFESKVEEKPLEQQVPIYDCQECKFESGSGDEAFDHKLENDHKIKKVSKKRIIGYEKKILGEISHITRIKDDVFILCSKCEI